MNAPLTEARDIAWELNRRFEERKVHRCEHVGWRAELLPGLKCADGFSVSVQASSTHYCEPRREFGPYYKVEVGYPTAPMPELADWAEVWGDDSAFTMTRGVWGYVPIIDVAELLASHGGLLPADRAE